MYMFYWNHILNTDLLALQLFFSEQGLTAYW
jgi:hypothetical protein